MYIRFVVGLDKDSPRIQNGLFVEAEALRKSGLLEQYEEKAIKDIFNFFNTYLPCPPYSKKKWSIDAISWFKDSASDFINKMREIQVILEQNDLYVRV